MVPALIAHGGAGADPDDKPTYRDAMGDALRRGWAVLRRGGPALLAVEATIQAMEDHPRFNAGHGSALTEHGTVECDASIMEGDTLQAGAVGAVSGVRSAIGLARRILEDGRHILLVGDGALTFAREQQVPLCPPESLVIERQRRALAKHLAARRETATQETSGMPGGTVGAVAIDVQGRIVAGTSTGGSTGKLPGRVGDSALIGAGTYADSRLGGVSTTGHGEAFIRTVLAKTALDILKELDDPQMAADVALDIVREEGRGSGGLIIMDWRGRLASAHSTTFMPVGWCQPTTAEPILPF
jgi:beta-aspartyl-peptidase (threonine type)